jgi:hypothetical protein
LTGAGGRRERAGNTRKFSLQGTEVNRLIYNGSTVRRWGQRNIEESLSAHEPCEKILFLLIVDIRPPVLGGPPMPVGLRVVRHASGFTALWELRDLVSTRRH